jgi:predicted nucleic acid-binding protein
MSGEMPAIFLDSNIWLYAFLPTQDKEKEHLARTLIQANRNNIVLSTQVVNEVVSNLLRKGKLKENEIRRVIDSFFEEFQIIALSREILLNASQLRERYLLSHWDGIIVAAALEANVDILYSEDMHHRLSVEKNLKILNPFSKLE